MGWDANHRKWGFFTSRAGLVCMYVCMHALLGRQDRKMSYKTGWARQRGRHGWGRDECAIKVIESMRPWVC